MDARGRPKASIRLADGRLIWGRSPGLLPNRTQDQAELHDRHRGMPASEAIAEYRRRDQLAEQLGGIIEGWGPAGRADVVTPAAVFEVERWKSWELGLQQVIGYAAQISLQPWRSSALYLRRVCSRYLIEYERLGCMASAMLTLFGYGGGTAPAGSK
jgi:hypothetical protein